MSPSDQTRDMLGRRGLTGVAEARSLLLERLGNRHRPTERLTLAEALDRITAEPIAAPEDLPPHHRSTMDGFAVVAADTFGATQSLPAYLTVIGEIRMGRPPEGRVERGTCYRIPTGGLLPDNADGVVMLEHTVPIDESMIEVVRSIGSGTNIIRKGDDIRAGNQALPAGHRLRPSDLGLLAGLGLDEITLCQRPRVGIIATGDEIVDHRQALDSGKIRNINSVTLSALAKRCGALVTDYGIVSDREELFFSTVAQAVEETDLVLFSGGSSVGVRDLGEQAIERLGSPGILIHGVSLKPGKPIIIGLCHETPIFGLPGHPVSAMVCFDFFVKPALSVLCGEQVSGPRAAPSVTARLMRNINSAAGRLDVIRVRLVLEREQWCCHPILGRSGAISTMSRADGYFLIDEDSQGLSTGEHVEVFIYP
ncbi:MAG: molybdopterin molybdotransferase MoeA [Desulfofustis sp.]|nr:molybdopterin molybdotransferase MoeA [Desulfofustis sp.]